MTSLENRVLEGNCFDLLPLVADQSVDMILCDIPYATTKNLWDKSLDLTALWTQYRRIIKPNGAILLFGQIPFTYALAAANLAWLRYEWVWEKTLATGHLNAKRAPMKAHENVLVFYAQAPTYNPQKTSGHERKVSSAHHKRNSKATPNYGKHDTTVGYDSTDRYPRSVLKFASDKQKCAIHPTQKPAAIYEYFIRTYTNPGELVLDNCAGSFTIGVAAENTGRRWIGMEQDPVYCEKGRARIEANRERLNAPVPQLSLF